MWTIYLNLVHSLDLKHHFVTTEESALNPGNTVQWNQMNLYNSHQFLKRLFLHICNLYGKLHLVVKKFLQKGQFKGLKKCMKNLYFATWNFSPIFSKWIYIFCAVQKMLRIYIFCAVSNEEGLCYHTHSAPDESIYCAPNNTIYRFIWREMCVITHSFLRSVRFWRI